MPDPAPAPPAVVRLDRATVVQGGRALLDEVSWELPVGEGAVVLGPNGAGKTTLLRLVAGLRQPTRGAVEVLGERIGSVDVRALRRRIGMVSDALGPLTSRRGPLRDLVAAALHGRTTAAARTDAASLERADAALHQAGVGDLGDRRGTEVSEGEWKRALLARALVTDPDLLLLDEPCTGLDLAERERFLARLDAIVAEPRAPGVVLVTHHLEEVPGGVTRALLLAGGRVAAAGPVAAVLTSATVSAAYGVEVEVDRRGSRWSAVASGMPPQPPRTPAD